MLRERNKLAHRSQRLVQTVELIGAAAVTSGQAAVAIERAINSSIICEIENSFAVRDYEIEIVLVGMNVRNRSEIRRASINVSQIKKCALPRPAAHWRQTADRALVDVDCSRVKIRRRETVGNRRKLQVVAALSSPAPTGEISAVRDAAVIQLRPGIPAIGGLPDSLIIFVFIHIPHVHLIASGRDRKFSAINRAALRGRSRRACKRAQPARLRGEPRPVHAIAGGIKPMKADCRKEFPGPSVVDHRCCGVRLNHRAHVVYAGVTPGHSTIIRIIDPPIRTDRVLQPVDHALGCARRC